MERLKELMCNYEQEQIELEAEIKKVEEIPGIAEILPLVSNEILVLEKKVETVVPEVTPTEADLAISKIKSILLELEKANITPTV